MSAERKTICSVCQVHYDGPDDGPISHGLCPIHAEKSSADLQAQKEELLAKFPHLRAMSMKRNPSRSGHRYFKDLPIGSKFSWHRGGPYGITKVRDGWYEVDGKEFVSVDYAQVYVKSSRRKSTGSTRRKPIPVARQSVSIHNLGSKYSNGSDCFEVILKRGGKPQVRIYATGAEQYRRALMAADLWSRGATVNSIEKVVGKHFDQ